MFKYENFNWKSLAAALEQLGISIDEPANAPMPLDLVCEAFGLCQTNSQSCDWEEFHIRITGEDVPLADYYGVCGGLCYRALQLPDFPKDLRERMTYAWGYYVALRHRELLLDLCAKVEDAKVL